MKTCNNCGSTNGLEAYQCVVCNMVNDFTYQEKPGASVKQKVRENACINCAHPHPGNGPKCVACNFPLPGKETILKTTGEVPENGALNGESLNKTER